MSTFVFTRKNSVSYSLVFKFKVPDIRTLAVESAETASPYSKTPMERAQEVKRYTGRTSLSNLDLDDTPS